MTKVDIMDNETDACEYLNGKDYKLKHGYIAVKCRSHQDNNNNKSISQALEDEKKFFETHQAYSKLNKIQGIPALAKKLSELLEEHIIAQMPQIEELVEKNYVKYDGILAKIGKEDISKDENQAYDFIISVIDEFKRKFEKTVHNSSQDQKDLESGEFTGGRKIYQYIKHFSENIIDLIDPFEAITDQMIIQEINNSHGLHPQLFMPEEACKDLIKRQICLFK